MTHWWWGMRDFFLLLVRVLWRLGVSLAVFGLMLAALWSLRRAYFYHFGFDRAQWAASADALLTDPEVAYDSPREDIVATVLAHELRPDMSRAAVQAVPGPADRRESFAWRYAAGRGRSNPAPWWWNFPSKAPWCAAT